MYNDPDRARAAEEVLLRFVREGNVHSKAAMDQIIAFASWDNYDTGVPKREAKNTVLIFTSLCSRAAIEGGLSPKTAKELEVYYISCVEKCNMMTDLVNLNRAMMEDFTLRVHRCKETPKMSAPIQECCFYIQKHLKEPMELTDIAKAVGYTEYYLTKKFKKETGIRLVDYIKNARIERAKILLLTTKDSIQDISDDLQFSARTYFSKVFKDAVGVSPAEYRINSGKENEE